MNVKTADTMIS